MLTNVSVVYLSSFHHCFLDKIRLTRDRSSAFKRWTLEQYPRSVRCTSWIMVLSLHPGRLHFACPTSSCAPRISAHRLPQ